MPITHLFESAVADGGNSSLVQPSDWNDDHVVTTSGVTPASGDKIILKDVSNSDAIAHALVSDLIDDTAYDATSWNGVTTVAPSKNAVRDKIEALVAGAASISDTAFGGGWNGDTTNGASKNALYDYLITLASLTGTETISSKRITPRVTSEASNATPTPDVSTTDEHIITAQSTAAAFAAPTGTPVQGDSLIIRIKDNGTARALSFNAIYRAIGVTLPTTTVISKTMYLGMIYNATDTKWDVLSVMQEA